MFKQSKGTYHYITLNVKDAAWIISGSSLFQLLEENVRGNVGWDKQYTLLVYELGEA